MRELKNNLSNPKKNAGVKTSQKILDADVGADVLAVVLNNINSAVFVVDKDRHILKYNNVFLDFFGIKGKDIDTIFCETPVFGDKLARNVSVSEERENPRHQINCAIKTAIDIAIVEGKETKNQILKGECVLDHAFKNLHYKFSVKPLNIEGEVYAIIIIDDITDIENTKLEIQKFNDLLKADLKLANKVQMSIIPKKRLQAQGYNLDFRYFPLGEVGGDVFDYFTIDKTHIGVLICDVMGHGLASSLVTTMVKATIESSRQLFLSPNKLVKYLNNQIIKIFENAYLTAIYGVIDTKNNTFTFVRAGHPRPWRLNKNSVTVMGMQNNIMLGVDPKARFKEDSFSIEKNSKIMIYTDGLIDIGKQNSGYESEVIRMVEESSGAKTCVLLDNIAENVGKRLEDQIHADDICVIVIERLE